MIVITYRRHIDISRQPVFTSLAFSLPRCPFLFNLLQLTAFLLGVLLLFLVIIAE
jgi:hypothetical protein